MKVWKIEFEMETDDEFDIFDVREYLYDKINIGEGYFAPMMDKKKFKAKVIKLIKDDE